MQDRVVKYSLLERVGMEWIIDALIVQDEDGDYQFRLLIADEDHSVQMNASYYPGIDGPSIKDMKGCVDDLNNLIGYLINTRRVLNEQINEIS